MIYRLSRALVLITMVLGCTVGYARSREAGSRPAQAEAQAGGELEAAELDAKPELIRGSGSISLDVPDPGALAGQAHVEFVVDADGNLRDLRVVGVRNREHSSGVQEAIAAWRFKPGTRNGQPVAYRMRLALPLEHLDVLDERPQPIHWEAPEYPDSMRRAGIGGRVVVEFVIDTRGRPQDVRVTETPHTEFNSGVTYAIGRWRFTPARVNGIPVSVRMRIPLNFDPGH